MKDNLKYIFGILIAAILLMTIGYFVGDSLFNKPAEVNHSSSNTKTVTTEEIKTTQNTLTIEQVGQIKKALTDSLRKVYGKIIESLRLSDLTPDFSHSPGEGNSDELQDYSYVSEIDTTIVVKDSSGSITDNLIVASTFISQVPLADNSVHLIKLNHTLFRKEKNTVTTTVDSVLTKEYKTFWERFKVIPNISAGYGLFNKQFDIYTGAGLSFEFNASELFK